MVESHGNVGAALRISLDGFSDGKVDSKQVERRLWHAKIHR